MHRTHQIKILVFVLVMNVVVALPGVASADHVPPPRFVGTASATDPDDSESRLDIRKITFKADGAGRARLIVAMHDRWDCDYYSNEAEGLEQQGGRWGDIQWRFRNGTESGETFGSFVCDENGSFAFRVSTDGGQHYEEFTAARPSAKRVATTVNLSVLHLSHDSEAYVRTSIFGLRDGQFEMGTGDESRVLKLSELHP
jgi:hypothetical protein